MDTANSVPPWDLDPKIDQPMEEEAGNLENMYPEKEFSSLLVLRLAFQSLGVVYGDLGTSPLYVFYNTFPEGIKDPEDVVGALSLIIYSLTLIPLIKYVFIVLRANDNGQGGTFALCSLLYRHAKVNTIPNQHPTDEQLTTYSRHIIHEKSFAATTKRWLEATSIRKKLLLILVLIGTCMVIGDGILTPAISVLSAVGGIGVDHPKMSGDVVVVVSAVILVGLFSMQHYGTDRVGWLFAPIVLIWFLLIGGIGAFNIWKYDSSVLRAFSPIYIYRYFKRGGWSTLGGIMLSITGTEALFADLAHFPLSAVRLAFTTIVFPCLLLAYIGQAAYIVQNQDHVIDAFYRSIPVFIIATGSAIIASQATISAAFSIIKQALALGCFPNVKVVHTSKIIVGQIYIPDINWILMLMCIAVTVGFRNQSQIGNAYGTAVVTVMLVTTFLTMLVMLLVWQTHWIQVVTFAVLSLIVECNFFSAVILKVDKGGWVPLAIAVVFFVIMYVWHYGRAKRYEVELHSKVSMSWILGLGPSLGLVRVPGIGLVYTELASGVPHIFSHLITNLPAIHSVVIFICVKHLPVYIVPEEERFLVKRIGPTEFHMFRCVARYGYMDIRKKDDDFEKKLFENLFLFVRLESAMEVCSDSEDYNLYGQQIVRSGDSQVNDNRNMIISLNVDTTIASSGDDGGIIPAKSSDLAGQTSHETELDEMEYLKRCRDAGVAHILGNTILRAESDAKFIKKISIDYIYAFLKRVSRYNSVSENFHVPHERLLSVGQTFLV
ncbi:potassium transporter 10-like isoform X2 [Papaver somniferum]|uniref:potassium transporter 10-like isoform X2 n=1 Tax=Papaver somniferum TaxID=3469 RepID=UPI000E705278|nr:potassium transporter 10-like isoform X2 [Papaver somniferum]